MNHLHPFVQHQNYSGFKQYDFIFSLKIFMVVILKDDISFIITSSFFAILF